MKTFRILAITLAMGLTVFAQSPTPKLSKAQIRSLVATASTAAEHHRLAEYFTAESHRYAAEAEDHIALRDQYKKNPMTNSTKRAQGTVDHCDYIAKSLKEASVQADDLAKMHEAMASDSGAK